MKVWVLLAIAVGLLLWGLVRERFEGATKYEDILKELGQTPGYASRENPPPVCPAGTILNSENKCVGSETTPFTCPEGYEVSGATCRRVDGTETAAPKCPAGKTFSTELGACEGSPVEPSCPGGYEYKDGQCKLKASAGATTGTTTGGGSVSSYGPTSGGMGKRNRQVFGPVFAGAGESDGSAKGDSSKTNVYPELLGGMPDTSTRIPGAGIVAPSKNWQLANNGSLPPASSLGTEEAAKYFPYSRQPGDMDVIPDPYRVSKTFSAASLSSKTEPVPFLTDFSAFLK